MTIKKKRIQGVFIDFDGTLVDSIKDLYALYCDFLRHYGHKGTKAEFKELNGPSLNEIMERLIQRHKFPEPSEKLLTHYCTLLTQYYSEIAAPFPGALDFISRIKNLGLKLILVTSADRRLVIPFLERFNLENHFDLIMTSEGLPHSKPDPAIYRTALLKIYLTPQHAFAIEDSLNGLRSASGAGLYTFLLNPKIKQMRTHEGWVEVRNWEDIRHLFEMIYE